MLSTVSTSRHSARSKSRAWSRRGWPTGWWDVDVVVRAAGSTFVADGWLRGKWISECRRCLAEMEGQLEVALSEVFEWEPSEGETWPISDYRIDPRSAGTRSGHPCPATGPPVF